MNPNGPIENPDLRALLNAHRDEIFAALNCHQMGTIEAFDKDLQTASVKINARRVVYDKPQTENGVLQQQPRIIDYPLLTDVPVFVASGGGARLTLPVAIGDTCLVLFNDRDLDAWWSAGVIAAPNSSRMHSLSDGLALVGFRSLANKITDYSATDAELRFGDASVAIKPDGTVLVTGKEGARVKLNPDKSLEVVGGEGLTATIAINTAGVLTLTGKEGGTVSIAVDGTVEAVGANALRPRVTLMPTGEARIRNNDGGWFVSEDGAVSGNTHLGSSVFLGEKVSLASSSASLLSALQAILTALTALNAKTGPSAAAQILLATTEVNNLTE